MWEEREGGLTARTLSSTFDDRNRHSRKTTTKVEGREMIGYLGQPESEHLRQRWGGWGGVLVG